MASQNTLPRRRIKCIMPLLPVGFIINIRYPSTLSLFVLHINKALKILSLTGQSNSTYIDAYLTCSFMRGDHLLVS